MWHLRTSFDREIMHIVPISGFFIGILLSTKEVNKDIFEKTLNYVIIGISFLIGFLIYFIIGLFSL